LFLGPTGVGKTELSKALAHFMFDTEKAMVRIDMSEYMEKHAVSRLVGAPPGYVGYEEGGQLTEAVRRRPYSVVLFDEIEKAHPEVFNILLQILEDGHITDSQGRRVDFKNTIIIMTSNIGSQHILDSVDKPAQEIKNQVEQDLLRHFRPEFINRIDEQIVFHYLTKEDIEKIIDIQLYQLHQLLEDRKISLELTADAREAVAEEGFHPAFGARPLKRVIEKRIKNPLAIEILNGHVLEKNAVIVDYQDEKYTFTTKTEDTSSPIA
jgi:ATP-dependent Clp protease ATP-binding subunit ClpA